jgi:flavin-dependent dehydrogenase
MSSAVVREDISIQADVAVIGGGPAGAATALALKRAGRTAVIIERLDSARPRVGETLPPAVRISLESLGLWSEFANAGHVPSAGNRSAWGSNELRDRDFIFSPYGSGWHLDRQRFDAMLQDAAVSAGVLLLRGTTLTAYDSLPDGGWRLHLKGPAECSSVTSRFVVDASGRAAVFAQQCGVKRHLLDRMIGVAASLEPGPDGPTCEQFTLVEAAESGWWYSALLPDGKLVVVYMTDADLASSRKLRSPENWLALLRQTTHTRERVASRSYQLNGPTQIVAANSSFLDFVTGDSWLAVGDAAAAYDPLSSQGILTALSTALNAAPAINAYLDGDQQALKDYSFYSKSISVDYLSSHSAYYAIERRWPDSIFWRRRHLPRLNFHKSIQRGVRLEA